MPSPRCVKAGRAASRDYFFLPLSPWLPIMPPTTAPPTVPTVLPPVKTEPATPPTAAPMAVLRWRLFMSAQPAPELLNEHQGAFRGSEQQQGVDFRNVDAFVEQVGSANDIDLAPAEPVDVEAILSALAEQNSEKLNWRTSIVDLMKLVGISNKIRVN